MTTISDSGVRSCVNSSGPELGHCRSSSDDCGRDENRIDSERAGAGGRSAPGALQGSRPGIAVRGRHFMPAARAFTLQDWRERRTAGTSSDVLTELQPRRVQEAPGPWTFPSDPTKAVGRGAFHGLLERQLATIRDWPPLPRLQREEAGSPSMSSSSPGGLLGCVRLDPTRGRWLNVCRVFFSRRPDSRQPTRFRIGAEPGRHKHPTWAGCC